MTLDGEWDAPTGGKRLSPWSAELKCRTGVSPVIKLPYDMRGPWNSVIAEAPTETPGAGAMTRSPDPAGHSAEQRERFGCASSKSVARLEACPTLERGAVSRTGVPPVIKLPVVSGDNSRPELGFDLSVPTAGLTGCVARGSPQSVGKSEDRLEACPTLK
jgi:hypothetical protein